MITNIAHSLITEQQHTTDLAIRSQQAAARRLADQALRESDHRLWVSGRAPSQLPFLVPDMIEEVFSYPGQARLVGLYLGAGEEAYYDDGLDMGTSEIDVFLLLVRHEAIAPRLQHYHLGSSEEEARYWLILDREKRQMTVAPAALAKQMVDGQWQIPANEQVVEVDEVGWALLVQEVQARMENMNLNVLMLEIERQLKVQEFLAWLDKHAYGDTDA